MDKYEALYHEFFVGYANGEWKNANQFGIKKGLKTTAGDFKRGTKGWTKKAKDHFESISEEGKERARQELVTEIEKDWKKIYSNLSEAAVTVSEKVKELITTNDFKYVDRNESERVDISALKGLMETGLNALKLHRGTYTETDIPLPTESIQKIEETKQIKAEEKPSTINVNTQPISIEIVGVDPYEQNTDKTTEEDIQNIH
jgi:hypothetical protein